MHGILNINKPPGITSFGVISRLRGILKIKKMGHAGTLDPDATGVLPVCIGKATKIIEFLMEKDKSYHVVMRLGIETDTQDASGRILSRREVNCSDHEISEAVMSFVGDIMQVPPMYSAVRVNGRKLYEMAREGMEVERKPRPVTIRSIENLKIAREDGDVRVSFDVACSKGTYIRTLCSDIGEKLGCGAHMESLVRTSSGPFRLEDAVTLEEVRMHADMGTLHEILIGEDKALTAFPAFTVASGHARRLASGQAVPCPAFLGGEGDIVRVYDETGEFIAVGRIVVRDGKTAVRSRKWLGGS